MGDLSDKYTEKSPKSATPPASDEAASPRSRVDPFRDANVHTYSHRPNVIPVYVLDTVSKAETVYLRNNGNLQDQDIPKEIAKQEKTEKFPDPYGTDINGSWFQFKNSIFHPTTYPPERVEIDEKYLDDYSLNGSWGGDARLKEEFNQTQYQQLNKANKHRTFYSLFTRTKDRGENDTKVRSTAGYWMGENRSQLKPAFRKFFMQNPLLPLTLRILTLIFCAIALALACSIFVFSTHKYEGAELGQKASTIMAIVVQTCALVYVVYIAYDEYSGKPLGLRDPIGKFRLVMLDLLFIIFSSANLSLAFDTFFLMSTLPAFTDLNATWAFIQPGLEFILGAQNDQGVTSTMYMNCYTAVYNYCVNKSRRGSTAASVANNTENNSYSLAGAEIYNKLEMYLVQFIRNLKKNPNESFLEFYVRRWTRFTIGAVYMNNVFDYMNRYWVQKERSDGRKDVFDVNTLSLIKWRNEMFQPNSEVLIEQVLDLIEKQRNHLIVDTNLISSAIKSLVFLSIDIQDLKKPNLIIYVNSFERPFLDATMNYYTKESCEYLANHNVVDYMKKCETRLAEEISRSNTFLEDHSKKAFVNILNQAMIENHASEMYDQFIVLLEQNQIDHIQRMYKLLSRVPKTLDPLASALEEYIKKEANVSLEKIKNQTEADVKEGRKKPGAAVEPKVYINTLIAIYNQFNDIVIQAFNKDTKFIRSLDNACRHFVNNNVIALPKPRAACKTPEYLAKYADGFLKSNAKDADIVDMNADNLMIVFKFINDKDTFEEHYRRSLAKRLINGTCKSDELEESVIHRLQEENSIEYTSKMTKMFSDMKASEDLKTKVKETLDQSIVKEFNPLILAQSMWPFRHVADYDLKVAPELEAPLAHLRQVYSNQHQGRKLQWLFNHGRAEVKANLSRKGKPPFQFQVSNVQLMILMAFNKKPTYSYRELCEIVGCNKTVFDNHLSPLIKFKLVEASSDNLADAELKMVEYYNSKKVKVNFISGIKSVDVKQEEEDATREIVAARQTYIQATIVRIMKSRKDLGNADLLNQVMEAASTRFTTRVLDIKKSIDTPQGSTDDTVLNDNNMKTYYFIQPKKKRLDSDSQTPFVSLLNGNEPVSNVRFRFELYQKIWASQLQKIHSILNSANDELFSDLVKFINEPLDFTKLSVGYIQLTSNNANNLRILSEFYDFSNEMYNLIKLNSKNCQHIKGTLKEIIRQFGEYTTLDGGDYLSYDLQVLRDWYAKGNDTRTVIVIEDTNLFSNQLLNQLIKLLQATHLPIKVLLALSCDTVSTWVNSNLRNDLRLDLEGYRFKSNDNKSLGYIILNNLFLTPELTDDNPLLINNTLSTIILNRFENSNNSIDALISEIKVCYMIFFYSSPLSILIAKFDSLPLYIDGLRKLPSFKRHMEIKLSQNDPIVKQMLQDDSQVAMLFQECKKQYQKHKLTIMNAINVVYHLHPDKPKEKFQLYKLLVNNKLFNSKYFHDCLDLSKYSAEVVSRIVSHLTDNCNESIGNIDDAYLIELRKGLTKDRSNIAPVLEAYFENPILTTPLEYMVFNEIFSLNGGIVHAKFDKQPLFEENFENLMINLLRPNLRQTIEVSLDNYELYLENPLVSQEHLPSERQPLLCAMFKVYKEAPASINLYDFYQAFTASLNKPDDVDDDEWKKITYSWFIQNCFEFMHMGILQLKKTSEYIEKAIWKGV
ncbi:CDC53 [Candida margitis]|uniref:CDC53 n=1 Tax=Candida margitis TaxID=1775924 RepID=UPI0022272401|nr:CDC53 [Candida margitis]KAI5967334.1 CDC53 [Candida margitis]